VEDLAQLPDLRDTLDGLGVFQELADAEQTRQGVWQLRLHAKTLQDQPIRQARTQRVVVFDD
jgi:hypothetical protein